MFFRYLAQNLQLSFYKMIFTTMLFVQLNPKLHPMERKNINFRWTRNFVKILFLWVKQYL